MELIGRRLPDTEKHTFPLEYDDLKDGDIWKCLNDDGTPWMTDYEGNLTGFIWMFKGPEDSGIGTLICHTVREHDDDTVSVIPGDGSSNSVLQGVGGSNQWHGYVDHNRWYSV